VLQLKDVTAESSLTGCSSVGSQKSRPCPNSHHSWEKHCRGTGSFTKPRQRAAGGNTTSFLYLYCLTLQAVGKDMVTSPPGHIECLLPASPLETYYFQLNIILTRVPQTLKAKNQLGIPLVTCSILQQNEPSPAGPQAPAVPHRSPAHRFPAH